MFPHKCLANIKQTKILYILNKPRSFVQWINHCRSVRLQMEAHNHFVWSVYIYIIEDNVKQWHVFRVRVGVWWFMLIFGRWTNTMCYSYILWVFVPDGAVKWFCLHRSNNVCIECNILTYDGSLIWVWLYSWLIYIKSILPYFFPLKYKKKIA